LDLTIKLENCENFGDVFEIVKKSVKEYLGKERAGLMLVLADLPLNLGAFHGVGTNSIVMNRTLLDKIVKAGHSRTQVNSFVYSILLHEYLHSLGLIEESEVRSLVREISIRWFGDNHPASRIATAGPWAMLKWPNEERGPIELSQPPRGMELVRDFDRSHSNYIS
jgi:hypothetical protein